MCSTHNKWQLSADTQDQDFPARDQHLKNLQERLQTGDKSIANIECISEEAIGVWIVQASFHKHLFEELLIQNSPKVRDIESQLSKHEIHARVLELGPHRDLFYLHVAIFVIFCFYSIFSQWAH